MCPETVLALKIQVIIKKYTETRLIIVALQTETMYTITVHVHGRNLISISVILPPRITTTRISDSNRNVSCKGAVKLCDIIAWFCEQQSCFQVCNFLEVKMHLFVFGPPCDLVDCNLFSELACFIHFHLLPTFLDCR